MSGHHKRRRGGSSYHSNRHDRQDKPRPPIDTSSVIVQQFAEYQTRLDAKHDRYERLVKLSRDVTIDSKRTIFLLQRLAGKEEERESILAEAHDKLSILQTTRWQAISDELHGQDQYQFIRAFSPGLQEYIEALSFCYYLEHDELIPLDLVQNSLKFTHTKVEENVTKEGISDASSTEPQETMPSETNTGTDHLEPSNAATDITDQSSIIKPTAAEQPISAETTIEADGDQKDSAPERMVYVPPIEYMLGIADLTGELMRVAITSIGNGNLDKPFRLCEFLRGVYDHILQIGNVGRELNRKVSTLRQSLFKVENACYTIKVRGSEVPQHMLVDLLKMVNTAHADAEDTGPIED